jgi:transcriptional regulator with XRE-family HTH domain
VNIIPDVLHLQAGIEGMSGEIGQDRATDDDAQGDSGPGMSGTSTMSDLGRRLRETRKAKKKTLRMLAEEVGCSPSMLSKIENDQAAPSLRTLHRILAALDTSIAHLFAGDASHDDIRLTPTFPELMLDANIHTLEPGADSGGDIQHAGQEVGYVLQGRAELIVDGKSHFLGPGDSFFFASNLPHRYRNIDPGVTRILWVATPATF